LSVNMSEWSKVLWGLVVSSLLGFGMGYLVSKLIETIFFRVKRSTTNKIFKTGQNAAAAAMAFMHGAQDGQKFMDTFLLGIYLYNSSKVRGYNRILDYFREQNIPFYFEEIIRDFISERRSLYEKGFISEEKWFASRRCGELLIHYQKNGNIEMQPLPGCNYIHGALRIKPSDEEFEDPNNVFALVWNIKNELTKFGLTERYLGACTSNGFDPILREHIAAGITEYSTRIVDKLIASSYEKYKNGSKKHTSIYRTIRKTKTYIEEYQKNRKIEWRVLPRIGIRELTLFFNSVQDAYQKELQHSGKLMPATMKNLLLYSHYFMLTLEDDNCYDFNRVSLKVTSDILLQMAFPLTSGVKQLLYTSRIFLEFLYDNKYTDADLKTAVPKLVAP